MHMLNFHLASSCIEFGHLGVKSHVTSDSRCVQIQRSPVLLLLDSTDLDFYAIHYGETVKLYFLVHL